MVLRRLILTPRLYAVVAMAQGLPVALVPEQLRITTMRDDMVNVRCLHIPAFLHALHTQWVFLQEGFSGFLPSTAVASTRSGTYLLGVQYFVTVTILLS